MDRQYIRDAGVIERYLQGTLTPAEEQAFEEAYLHDTALLEEIQLAERLRQGIKDAGPPARSAATAARRPWLAFAGTPRYATAASLVAVAALAVSSALYLENRTLRAGGDAPSAAASSMRLLPLVTVRGAGDANVVAAPRGGEWTVLLLDPGFADFDRYRAVLVRLADGAELLRIDELSPTYEGLLAVGVPAAALPPGDYEVLLEAGRGDSRELEELSRTPLTVAPRP